MIKRVNMKNNFLVMFYILVILFINGCSSEVESESDDMDPQLKIIEGFDFNNYPKVDGSSSAEPLNRLIACKLLGIKYHWTDFYKDGGIVRGIEPILKLPVNINRFNELVNTTGTHPSVINLIDKEVDFIISARKISKDEKEYADNIGVSLIEIPIALDAFIFIVNKENPITSLTTEQIQDIYTGKITNWNEVGGNNEPINPYVREANSGSQELMDLFVMKGLSMEDFPVSWEVIHTMTGAFEKVQYDTYGICYTVFYYKEHIINEIITNSIAIEGTYPNIETISNNTYPFVAEVYAIIRSDLDKLSMPYKLAEFLQTDLGKNVIKESGYLSN